MNYLKITIATVALGLSYFLLENHEAPTEENEFFYHFSLLIFDEKKWIGFYFTILFLILLIYWEFRTANRIKRMVNDYLEDFIKRELDSDFENNRITIFKKVRFFRALRYFLFSTAANLPYYLERKCLLRRLASLPLPFRSYLIIYEREGQPNTNKRYTFFRVVHSKDKINGFASYCFYSRVSKSITLGSIDDIELKNFDKLSDITDIKDRTRVKKFMDDSLIRKFWSLKSFKVLPLRMSGYPLFLNEKNQKMATHVILFDSVSSSTTSFDDRIDRLAKHIGIILKK